MKLLYSALEVSMHIIPLALYFFNWWDIKKKQKLSNLKAFPFFFQNGVNISRSYHIEELLYFSAVTATKFSLKRSADKLL